MQFKFLLLPKEEQKFKLLFIYINKKQLKNKLCHNIIYGNNQYYKFNGKTSNY